MQLQLKPRQSKSYLEPTQGQVTRMSDLRTPGFSMVTYSTNTSKNATPHSV